MRNPCITLQGKKQLSGVLPFLLSVFFAQPSFASSEANLVLPNLKDAALASFLGIEAP